MYVENYLLNMKVLSIQTHFLIKEKELFCVLILLVYNNTRKYVEYKFYLHTQQYFALSFLNSIQIRVLL